MYTTHEAGDRLGIKSRSVIKAIKEGLIKAEKRGRDYWIEDEEVERYARERRAAHRPRKETAMEAKLIGIAIVNDAQQERYQLVYEYSDGTQSGPQGSYATSDQAYEEVRFHEDAIYADEYEQVPIRDKTRSGT